MRKNCRIMEGQDNIAIISSIKYYHKNWPPCYPVFCLFCKLEIILLNLYSDCEIVVSPSVFSFYIRFLCCIINYKSSSLKRCAYLLSHSFNGPGFWEWLIWAHCSISQGLQSRCWLKPGFHLRFWVFFQADVVVGRIHFLNSHRTHRNLFLESQLEIFSIHNGPSISFTYFH